MKRIFLALCVASLASGCLKVPVRGKAIPVDYNRDKVLYQAQCTIDADLRGLPGVLTRIDSQPADSCALKAMNTCKSDYKILHRAYGEAHWRLLDTHDPLRKVMPKRYRAQDLVIDFICLPAPAAEIYVPVPEAVPYGGDFYTKDIVEVK